MAGGGRTLGAVALGVLALAGCGGAASVAQPSPHHRAGPFQSTRRSAVAALRRAGIEVRRVGPAGRYGRLLRPSGGGRYRTATGTAFDLLIYRSPQVAVRALPGVRAEARRPTWLRHNVIVVFRRRRRDVDRVRAVIERLGATSSVPDAR